MARCRGCMALLILPLLAVAAGDDPWIPQYGEGVLPLDSPEGDARLREAVPCTVTGALIGSLATQITQSYCGLASLCTIFNALDVVPGPALFNRYEFWTQDTLLAETGTEDDVNPRYGVTLDELAYVASRRVRTTAYHAGNHSIDTLRSAVRDVFSDCAGRKAITCNFRRAEVTVSGGGHHSPLGAFHSATDSVLVLDTSRYKFPPYWVPLALLHKAMDTIDSSTSNTRGWLLIDASDPVNLPPSLPRPPSAVIGFVSSEALASAALLAAGMVVGCTCACGLRLAADRRQRHASSASALDGDRDTFELAKRDSLGREDGAVSSEAAGTGTRPPVAVSQGSVFLPGPAAV
jgi:hypothetical protein